MPGDVVLIEGPGAIGLFAMQIAKLSGAITVLTGITKDGGRMQLAKELGCDYTLDVQRENLIYLGKHISCQNILFYRILLIRIDGLDGFFS